jgi:16S rRNA (guanine966-N2)-methyltransferase
LRIITGYLKGRTFNSPKGEHTHPMGDKIRGALFNILGDIEGLHILDAFAGSGAIGFEALSRGAASATLIESDRVAQKNLTLNIHKLDLEKSARLVSSSTKAWLARSDDIFDVVIIDPPYDDIQQTTFLPLADRTKPGGILALSLPPSAEIKLSKDFHIVITKSYGDAQLHLYRRN